MQKLNHILNSIHALRIAGNPDKIELSGLTIDSRKVKMGDLFIAIRGAATDGHQHISSAIEAGAVAIVCEQLPEVLQENVCYVQVANSAIAAGWIAAAYYGNPSAAMKVVGITGTNGKTTIATLLYQLFKKLGFTCGLISTVKNYIGDEEEPSTHTTPDALQIQKLLSKMHQKGCAYVFMEVSSHAIHQHRIAGIQFTGGVFSNITHDHLDYHQTFDAYIKAKKAFFDELPNTAFALTNLDDKRGKVMLQNTQAKTYTYSLKNPADFKGKIFENNLTGLVMLVDDVETHFRMIGTFNAYNLLAVYGVATLLQQEKTEVLAILSNLTGARGRFQICYSKNENILGIVDYAHTPDALINVTGAINQIRKNGQLLISVVGCGGDRDKEKRPLMAEVAATHSDKLILTSDNPRSEDPEQILDEMEAGLTAVLKRKCLRISDRKEAIKTACMLAQKGDIILIAGKGHETWQEIKGEKFPFDDYAILEESFELLNK